MSRVEFDQPSLDRFDEFNAVRKEKHLFGGLDRANHGISHVNLAGQFDS